MFSKAQKAVIQLVLGVALCSPAGAAQLDLINLHNYTGLYPNVLLSMDDSGSMSVNYLRASPLKPDLNLYQQAGVTLGPDWRELSGDFNVVYYNPRIEYTPWVGRPDADVAAALSALGGLSFTIWQDTSWLQPLPVGGHRYALGADGLIDYWDNHIAVHVTPAGVFDVRQITLCPSNNVSICGWLCESDHHICHTQ